MSRTLPCRCGCDAVQTRFEQGGCERQRGVLEGAGILQGAHERRNRTQQYRPSRDLSLIYCVGSMKLRTAAGVASGDCPARVVPPPREPWRRVGAGAARAAGPGHRGALLVGLTYWVRAVRWQYLLAPIGPTRFRTAFRTTVIGFAALSLLPARAGDLLRPYLLARQEGLSAPATFATIVMERVLDLIAVLIAAGGVRLGLRRRRHAAARPCGGRSKCPSALAAVAAIALMGVMWVLATHPERIGGVRCRGHARAAAARRRAPRRSSRARSAAASPWRAQPRALALAFLWSLPLWLALALEVWLVTRAFGIAMPFTGSVPAAGAAGHRRGGADAGRRRQLPRGLPHRRDDVLRRAERRGRRRGHRACTRCRFVPVVLVGMVFMAQDGLSVGRLQALAGTAREEEMPDTDEVPVLRPSGR